MTTVGQISVAVEVPSTGCENVEVTSVRARYCDFCRCWGDPRTVHVCGSNWYPLLEDLLGEMQRDRRRRCLIADARLVPDPDAVIRRFAPEFDKLLYLALMGDWEQGIDSVAAEALMPTGG